MCLVRCENHPLNRKIVRTPYHTTPVQPIGFLNTAAVCGRRGCSQPGEVWLTVDEARAYRDGQRVFGIRHHAVKIRAACLLAMFMSAISVPVTAADVPARTPEALRQALTTVQETRTVLREAASDTPTRSEDAAARLEKLDRAAASLHGVVTALPNSGFASQARKLLPQIEGESARMKRITTPESRLC